MLSSFVSSLFFKRTEEKEKKEEWIATAPRPRPPTITSGSYFIGIPAARHRFIASLTWNELNESNLPGQIMCHTGGHFGMPSIEMDDLMSGGVPFLEQFGLSQSKCSASRDDCRVMESRSSSGLAGCRMLGWVASWVADTSGWWWPGWLRYLSD